MPQFTKRFQPPPSYPQNKEVDVRLRTSVGAYPQGQPDSVYTQRSTQHQQETDKIKGLSFWRNTELEDREEGSEETEWTERQSPVPFILAVVILVIASALLWLLFQWASSENTNTPLVIPADIAPFKVRPENPGGMKIPHQDKLIYGRISQNTLPQPMERLLPPPEQPIAAPLPQPQQPPQQHPLGYAPVPQQPPLPSQQPYYPSQDYHQGQGYAPSAQGYSNPAPQGTHPSPQLQQEAPQLHPSQAQAPYPQPSLPSHPAYAPPSPSPSSSPYGPPVVPSQSNPIASPPMASPYPTSVAKARNPSTVEDIKPAVDTEEDEGITKDAHDELNRLIDQEAQTPLKSTSKKDAKLPKLAPLDPGKHKIQIAAFPSRSMAEQEIKRLRMRHGPVFGNKSWNVQKVSLASNRGVAYRLVVGSFPNQSAAAKFCKKLRSEKIGCKVVAPVK